MGRYGLVTPNSIFHDLALETNYDAIPPRFVWAKINTPGDGTLGVVWAGVDTLSGEAYVGSSYGQIYWDCTDSAAPGDILRVVAQVHSEASPPPFTPNLYFTTWLEYHHGSVLMGHTPQNALGQPFIAPGYSGFQSLANSALWGLNGGTRARVAVWADVPSYHPYRR